MFHHSLNPYAENLGYTLSRILNSEVVPQLAHLMCWLNDSLHENKNYAKTQSCFCSSLLLHSTWRFHKPDESSSARTGLEFLQNTQRKLLVRFSASGSSSYCFQPAHFPAFFSFSLCLSMNIPLPAVAAGRCLYSIKQYKGVMGDIWEWLFLMTNQCVLWNFLFLIAMEQQSSMPTG